MKNRIIVSEKTRPDFRGDFDFRGTINGKPMGGGTDGKSVIVFGEGNGSYQSLTRSEKSAVRHFMLKERGVK